MNKVLFCSAVHKLKIESKRLKYNKQLITKSYYEKQRKTVKVCSLFPNES